MKEFGVDVAGEKVRIRVIEHHEDLTEYRAWLDENPVIAIDSETTGLDIYSDTYRLRLVQVSNRNSAWVIPVEKDPMFQVVAEHTVREANRLIVHNAAFDLAVFDQCLGVTLEETYPKTTDTRILSHLVDSRGEKDGGIGHSLEALTIAYIDREVGETVKGSMKELAAEFKTTKAKIFSLVDIDHPGYLTYSGMDPILTWRLAEALVPHIPQSAIDHGLIEYEHRIASVCARMSRHGFLLDVPYSEKLSEHLLSQETEAKDAAYYWWGVSKVASGDQVADALEAVGTKIGGRTPTGKRKVDKALLDSLIADPNHPAHTLALWVTEAKQAQKARTTWVDGFLDQMDSSNRVHPFINPLAARTARMSITGIPAQTLPATDWLVRRCFIPEPGQSLLSVDYQAQELRVLAALSGDPVMRRAFEYEADLHQLTADAAGVDRKVGKMANFLQVYGGGAGTLAANAGIDFLDAKRVVEAFRDTYQGVTAFSKRLEQEVQENGYVVTPTGRRLVVDEDRGYSGLNYMVQSTSRDVTCRGLLQLDELGLIDYLRLPIHDEVLLSVPDHEAVELSRVVQEALTMDLAGVSINTDAEVYGESWGGGYVKDQDRAAYERTLY